MTRRCSHCRNNGHNARTCPSSSSSGGGGVKLFGVRLTVSDSFIKKSASMGTLHYHSSSSAAASPNNNYSPDPTTDGYLSDDPSCSAIRRRKKGVAWTEEEHRLFLVGLHKLGKGDWRGISRSFVVSRTPTQVASHAQKYFIRQTNGTRRKRRSSLFDMATDTPPVIEEQFTLPPQATDTDKMNSLPSLNLSLKTDYESKEDATHHEMAEDVKHIAAPRGSETSHHDVLKPIAMLCKEPVNVEELVGMSYLSIGETGSSNIGSSLSLKLFGESLNVSAYHVSTPPVNVSDVDK